MPMPHRPDVPELLRSTRVVAIARHIGADDAPGVGAALVAGGVRVMEITLNEPEPRALAAIAALAEVAGDLGALVGAGTVLSVESARRAVDAGAGFIVTPHTDVDIAAWCAVHDVPCLPGALTPSEILAAWQAGASAVKLFPAVSMGPGYLAQIRGPFPEIPLVPTGGVSAETAEAWITSGALAVGMGSWLIGDGEPGGVTERSQRVRAAVDAAAA